jgi:hypothetical protein
MSEHFEPAEAAFWFPDLPPSVNEMYFTKGKRRILTSKARAYKQRFISEAWEACPDLDRFVRQAGDRWFVLLEIDFYFASLVNKGWLTKTRAGKRKAAQRYKRVDASNRVKLLEDAVSECMGIDDSRFQVNVRKHMSPETGVSVQLSLIDPTTYGVPDEYVDSAMSGVRNVRRQAGGS